jgi:hypothetical protein
MKYKIAIAIIAVILFLTVYLWPASHVVGNFDPRADENSQGECP